MFNFDCVAAHQEFCDSETPELKSGDEIRQVFTSLENFLYRVELMFSSTAATGDGIICFQLYEGNQLELRTLPLVTSNVDVSRVSKGGWRSFEFLPLRNSQIQTYTIVLKMVGSGSVKLRKLDGIGEKYFFRMTTDKGALAYRAIAVRDFTMYDNFKMLRNEMRSNQLVVKHKPIMMRLEISAVCNQQCIMCAHGQDWFNLPKGSTKNMSLKTFNQVVAPLIPTTSTLVAFGLGEPFLNKDFIEILRRTKKINPLIQIFVSTNGTRLSEERSREIIGAQLIDILQISIDGASEETYAKIRKRSKQGSDYKVVMDALKRLIEIKKQHNKSFPRIKVEMLVSQHTEREVFAFVERMTNLGVNTIVLDSVKGYYPGLSFADCDIDQINAELQRAKVYAERAGVSIEGPLLEEVAALLTARGTTCAGVG